MLASRGVRFPNLVNVQARLLNDLSEGMCGKSLGEVPGAAREMMVYWARQARKRIKRRRPEVLLLEPFWGT